MEIGFAGLGRMGFNMALRLVQGGHDVVAWNRSPGKVDLIREQGARGAYGIAEMAAMLVPPRVVWVMVPAGEATEEVIAALLLSLSPGDIVVDGGNSYYRDSVRRASMLEEKGLRFIDVGTSGGIWGLEKGYCLMAGGDRESFTRLEPILRTLAPPEGYLLAGKSGAGHFAKMVHNGIEYGLLQAYAEGFEILNARKDYGFDLGALAHLWNQGSVIRSWLLELSEHVFAEDPGLAHVTGYLEDSGEGRWTVNEALECDVPAPVITLSLQARLRSRQCESFGAQVIAALRNEFGGHAVKRKES